MHEAVIAQGLFTSINQESSGQKGRPVKAKITCGVFNAVNSELLDFAFAAIAQGTICEGIKFEVEQKPVRAVCNECGIEFVLDLILAKCPCGSEDFKLQPDAPLVLEEIEFEME